MIWNWWPGLRKMLVSPECGARLCGGGAVLEGAGGGGADGDDAAFVREGLVDGGGGGGGEGVGLGVEADVGEVLDADGLEGAEADVEGDGFGFGRLWF